MSENDILHTNKHNVYSAVYFYVFTCMHEFVQMYTCGLDMVVCLCVCMGKGKGIHGRKIERKTKRVTHEK